MRTIGCFFMFIWLFIGGCMLDRSALGPAIDAGASEDIALPPSAECGVAVDAPTLTTPEPTWPRSHPAGTLLVDHERQLWMAIENGTRMMVSGDDTLGEISLDEDSAIPMTLEEERCLRPIDEYWGPGNFNWNPVYGPDDDDTGPFILDDALHVRRPVSNEVLESWGYYWRWMDEFPGSEAEWLAYTVDPTPIPIRDGTLVHTEHGFYYVVQGRSYYFRPTELVAEAGYLPETALWIPDLRLRSLAPAAFAMDHNTFNLCPADFAAP